MELIEIIGVIIVIALITISLLERILIKPSVSFGMRFNCPKCDGGVTVNGWGRLENGFDETRLLTVDCRKCGKKGIGEYIIWNGAKQEKESSTK